MKNTDLVLIVKKIHIRFNEKYISGFDCKKIQIIFYKKIQI